MIKLELIDTHDDPIVLEVDGDYLYVTAVETYPDDTKQVAVIELTHGQAGVLAGWLAAALNREVAA